MTEGAYIICDASEALFAGSVVVTANGSWTVKLRVEACRAERAGGNTFF